jgi:hypothetical protein
MLTNSPEDFRRLPEVLALPLPEAAEEAVQDALALADDALPSPGTAAESPAPAAGPAEQLGLF